MLLLMSLAHLFIQFEDNNNKLDTQIKYAKV